MTSYQQLSAERIAECFFSVAGAPLGPSEAHCPTCNRRPSGGFALTFPGDRVRAKGTCGHAFEGPRPASKR